MYMYVRAYSTCNYTWQKHSQSGNYSSAVLAIIIR